MVARDVAGQLTCGATKRPTGRQTRGQGGAADGDFYGPEAAAQAIVAPSDI